MGAALQCHPRLKAQEKIRVSSEDKSTFSLISGRLLGVCIIQKGAFGFLRVAGVSLHNTTATKYTFDSLCPQNIVNVDKCTFGFKNSYLSALTKAFVLQNFDSLLSLTKCYAQNKQDIAFKSQPWSICPLGNSL